MNNKQLLALYGLKYNPFLPDIPPEALWSPPGIDMFCFRLENLLPHGGFALICGEPGLGKSKVLQLLDNRLNRLNDVVVGVMERPQSSLNDFYREMGALFGVNLSPANRYGGFKALRERWQNHIKSTLCPMLSALCVIRCNIQNIVIDFGAILSFYRRTPSISVWPPKSCGLHPHRHICGRPFHADKNKTE